MRISAQKLFFLILFLFITFLLLPTSKVHAQTSDQNDATIPQATYQTTPTNTGETDPDVASNIHNNVQILLIESMSAISCQLTGFDPSHPNTKCIGLNPRTGKIGYVENGGGMIALVGKGIDMTFVPPASFTQYTAYLKGNFGVGDKAYAATTIADECKNLSRGVGFCGLQPVLPLWITMRNIVYLILILAFVIIGLGIMLRVHADAHTIMTIQNQLPKIILGIIAVTFSFAIAGFLIDVMFVTTYLFASVLTNAMGGDISRSFQVISAPNPLAASNAAFDGGVLQVASNVSAAFAEVIKSIFTGPSTSFGNGDIVGNVVGGLLGIIVNVAAFLIIAIAIVVALLRCWFVLIISYVNLILDVIFAPFWIIAGVMPGSSSGIGAWLKDMLANLAVYPLAVAFFLLAEYFTSSFSNPVGADTFIPPLTGGVNSSAVGAIVGMGFILMLPNVLTTTKQALKAPGVNFGNIMGPISVGAGAPQRLIGGATAFVVNPKHDAHGDAIPNWKRAAIAFGFGRSH